MTAYSKLTGAVAHAARVAEQPAAQPDLLGAIVGRSAPLVLRGLAADWPAVAAGRESPEAMARYVGTFDRGLPVNVMIGMPEFAGRFFYNHDLSGFNFQRARIMVPVLLKQLLDQQHDAEAPSLYAGATSIPEHYPDWPSANPLPLALPAMVPRLWIGNASRVSTHYDVSINIAVAVAGHRRFALFPPDQSANLYVGPLEATIAGQPTSMVDLEAPDLDRYPRFAAALAVMQVAELEPGDALFIPSLWWHDVRASGALNVLVNYWQERPSVPSPFPALIHALLAVRDLPAHERAAVRSWFDHYVFGDDALHAADHLPEAMRGVLGVPSAARARLIRAYLKRALGL